MSELEKYQQSQALEHLGLVAAMFDKLAIGELIDELIPQDLSRRKVSVGQALKAMVFDSLGFANRRWYLMSEFFRNKPTGWMGGAGHLIRRSCFIVATNELDEEVLEDAALEYRIRQTLGEHEESVSDQRASLRAGQPPSGL